MTPNTNPDSKPPEAISALELLPDALFGGSEALEESDDTDSLWDRFPPSDVPFFKIALLDRLLRRPYHAVMLEGPFNTKQLVEDRHDKMFRSETSINRSGYSCIYRLLLCLGDGLFGYLEGDSLKLYAPTPQAAEAAARKFRKYVKPQAVGKPRFYIISLEPEGPSTETVILERSAPVTTEELALNYGADFPSWRTLPPDIS